MKEKTPEGDFFTYDEESRERGRPMFQVACLMAAIVILVRIYVTFIA